MNALLAKLPLWVKIVGVIGPTAWIAIMLTGRIPTQLDTLSASMELHAAQDREVATELRIFENEQRNTAETIVRLMRQVCINGAKSEFAIQKCLE